VADDVGFVALTDLSQVMVGDGYRIIGGHMVMALVARWALGDDLYRQTQDTDIAVPPVAVRGSAMTDQLLALGYTRRSGNRFARPVSDLPVRVTGLDAPTPQAVIDILVPSYTSRPNQNRNFGKHLATVEVPGLAAALQRDAAMLRVELHRMNGDVSVVELAVADEVSALVLKAHATIVRSKATDVVDLWRCLEVCFAAGIEPAHFTGVARVAAVAQVRRLFKTRDGAGMTSIAAEQRLVTRAADERFTRINALIERVLGWD
jgi:hypothetical protein